MNKIDKKYEDIHELCFNNKEILKKVGKCVCIDCGRRFDFDEIYEWVYKDLKSKKDTALCPYCSIDSVLPTIVDGEVLTDKDIDIMSRYYFWNDGYLNKEGDKDENKD